ncbi:hypothetical protein ACGF0D_10475 [Kitasatospora sp. NPDC048298]|uniref:hypothetical protein n=1 Tax=Kitasatospora sp. NPDC048298 TaxID=3364049 RepID=UPI003714EBBB
MILPALIALSVAVFAALLWLDWRARRRVRPVRAAEVTPEQIRYVARRSEKGDR